MLETLNLTVDLATKANVDWMIRRHYLRKWPGVVRAIFLLRSNGEPVGVIVYAMPPRETNKRYHGETWELARLWVDDVMPRNTESWFIAQTIKRIRKSHADLKTLVSYADPSAGHRGTIYRASNWTPDGRTDDDRKSPRVDYVADIGDLFGVKPFSRRRHIPVGAVFQRVPRVSKIRFYYHLDREIVGVRGERGWIRKHREKRGEILEHG